MTKKSKIQYGKENLLPQKIEPKDENVRISIVMEGDLLDALKARAAQTRKPYQTLMKEILRQNLGKPSMEERLARLEAIVNKAS